MSITATELKNNLEKYLQISATEDVFITRNGEVVAKLTSPYHDRVETAKSLFGILPKDEIIEGLEVNLSLDHEFARIEENFVNKAGRDYAASRGE